MYIKQLISFICLSVIMSCSPKSKNSINDSNEDLENVKLLVGTYTSDKSNGIYAINFNLVSGQLKDTVLVAKTKNPSFIVKSKDEKIIYAANENELGTITSFVWNESQTKLIEENEFLSQGMHPCYVALNEKNDLLAVANYSSGNIAVYSVNNEKLFDTVQVRNHSSKSIISPTQNQPHAHSIKFNKSNDFLYVADLGIDEIVGYSIDNDNNLGEKFTAFKMDAGDGPRHIEFHPTKNILYIISEFSNAITVVELKKDTGKLTKVGKYSTLPENFIGESFAADLHISADGNFLYASNRGHNSIAIFAISDDGKLDFLSTEKVRGNWPRNFTLSPDGSFLIVANQKSDNITVFKINKKTGVLSFTGVSFNISKPVCLLF